MLSEVSSTFQKEISTSPVPGTKLSEFGMPGKKPKRRVIPKNDNKHMTLNSGDGDKPTTSGSEKKVAFSDIDGEEEMAKIPEEDEEDLQVEEV